MKKKDILQKWQKDFESFYSVYSTFLIDGFVDDLQPYVETENEEVESNDVLGVGICEYFENLFVGKEYQGQRNLLVVYDPTEAVGKRFNIHSSFEPTPVAEGEEREIEVYASGTYPQSHLANHFYEILRSEDIENTLIDHSYNGASPDFAKIHYAISEEERLADYERVFKQFFEEFAAALNGNVNQEINYVFVIKMLSRLKTNEDSKNLSGEELEIFRQLLTITKSIMSTNHKLIILSDKSDELPKWFSDDMLNYNVKVLHVTKPTDKYKEFFFNKLIENNMFGERFAEQYRTLCEILPTDSEKEKENKEESKKRLIKKFLAYSNDFSMQQLHYYETYLEDENHAVLDVDKLGYSLTAFRFGDLENPWDNPDTIQEILRIDEKVKRKLMGQDFAIEAIQEIITRSTVGLDRIDNPDAPRIILFLAGPTGTGKTEVCKQIANVVFGSPDRIVRFDMSEYGADESDQKLFGAPPGYVGYEEGGKLTNAIMKEPFSLVLFDEIEKAHPSILDKFLQILSDGRLTSGKGETVSFTDSIIVITSNAGVTSAKIEGLTADVEEEKMGMVRPTELVNMTYVAKLEEQLEAAYELETKSPEEREILEAEIEKEIYQVVSSYLKYFVKFYFVCFLNRPELYGRVEDSIVYYNYICKKAVPKICKAKLESATKAAIDKYQVKFNSMVYDENNPVFLALVKQCQTSGVRALGARGIGKEMNKLFNGSLSNYLKGYILAGRIDELVGVELTCNLTQEYLDMMADEELEEKVMTVKHIEWSPKL